MAGYTLEEVVDLPKRDYGIEEFKLFSEFLAEGYELHAYLGTDVSRGTAYDYFSVIQPDNTLEIARYSETQACFKYLSLLKSGVRKGKKK